jgi:hypothetical protein
MAPEQIDPITRKQFAEMKFNHQVQKAYRKGKLVEVSYWVENNETVLLVDPALVKFIYSMGEANGLVPFEETYDSLLIRFIPRQQKKPDVVTRAFSLQSNKPDDFVWGILQKCATKEVYKLLVESDPTPNKEYVQWILTMYTRVLKDREPRTSFDSAENIMGGFAYLFFENLYKVSDALKIFHKIKNTKLLNADQRDIYTYKSIDHFVEVVFSINIDAPTEINHDILNVKEWEQLNARTASVVHQDDDWIIVHTATKEANVVFGEHTMWCTAGNRYGSMFDSYNKQGKLFVLVKNKLGVSSHIKSNPENRLQFHFESDQFMNALDRSIDVVKFFREYAGVKSYFRDYIVNVLLKKSAKVEDMIKTLNRFAMVKELIPILKEMKVKKLDLSGAIGSGGEFELEALGDIVTLEELTMRDCALAAIPQPIRNLPSLKILRLSGNKITSVPPWINELTKLEVLNLMKNDILEPFDVSGLAELCELHVGFNKKLKSLPTGLKHLKKITSIDCSICDIRAVDEEVLECKTLIQFNVIKNKNLTNIPTELINLPKLLYLGLDETNIPAARYRQLESAKINKQTVLL